MLYDFLSTHRAEILAVCLAQLKSRDPDRPDDELIDDIPVFLDEIITALRSDTGTDEAQSGSASTMAAWHGIARKKQGFDLARLVHDFGFVCEAIMTTAQRHNETPAPREFQIVNRCVDAGIAVAVESYNRETRADQEFEKAKDLGMLAHEIRNALSNAMLGFELIRYGHATASGLTSDVVQRSLRRIGTLVADTLAAAQMVHGVVTRRETIRIAQHVAQLTQDLISERGVTVQVDVPEDLVVDADERLLGSALSNLVQNAIKFTGAGEKVVLRASQVADAVCIEVEDRCGGLPDETADDLFRPFVRKNADRSGVGLGLVIARRAIEAHGGTLRVRNLPGVGCVFTVLIPAHTSEVSGHRRSA